MDLKEYLESKNCEVTVRGEENVSTHCFFCDEDKNKAGRLYVNNSPDSDKYGLFFCFLCNESGNVNKIRRHFGDEPIDISSDVEYNPVIEAAASYYEAKLLENVEAYRYLMEERGFTEDTIKSARFGWADGGLVNHLIKHFKTEDIKSSGLVTAVGEDFFRDEIIIPYLHYGKAFQLRSKKIGGKYRSAPGSKMMLYGIDHLIGEKTAIITEGELCALHLQQLGFAAVGVPGANTWKADWLELFDEAKRIYVIYDSDKAGKAGAENVASKVGPRSRIVSLPQKNIDIEDYIVKYSHNIDDVSFLLRKAKGGILVSVHEAVERWQEIEGNPDVTGIRFNVPRLDSEMNFGLLPGQVMTMIAKTNSGKSLMSINFFERIKMLNPDIKILYISLEQTRNEWFERANRIHNFYEPGASIVDVENFWSNNFFLVDKNRISEEELYDSIEQFEYETGSMPDIVCIDYLGYYARGVEGASEYDRTTNAIMNLKAVAKELQVSMIVPHQSNRTGDFGKELRADMAKSSGAIEETSDILLSLWNTAQKDQDQQQQNPDDDGAIFQRILKSRNGRVNGLARYTFCPLTLAMVPDDDVEYHKRALFERQCFLAGDNYQTFIGRLKTGDNSI